MTELPRIPIQDLVVEERTKRTFSSDADVWSLNLDQIESDSGRILARVMVHPKALGPSTYPFESGTVLYSKLRPYLNKVVVADADGYATTELVPVKCDETRVLPSYLAYFLRSPEFLNFANTVVAGAKMPRMVMGEFWSYKVPLPPLTEQRRIAAILDQADALRAKRRETLAQLEKLKQSIFLDTFGDLFLNTNGYPISKLGDICDVRDGTHDSPKYFSEGYPLVTSKNLRDGKIDLTEANLISEEDYIAINKRSKVDMGDILMPMIGTIGNPVLVEFSPEFAIKNMALIKFSNESPSRQFILSYLGSNSFDKFIERKNKGGTQKFLALGEIRALSIPLPPKSLQEKFSELLLNLNKHRNILANALRESDVLFQSIQYRAFKGEL